MPADPRRSPFPGMDPWLEASWGDVHHEIISRLADQIADALPSDLFVTVQERVYVVAPDDEDEGGGQWVPDVATLAVGRSPPQPAGTGGGTSAAAAGGAAVDIPVAEPIHFTVAREPVTEGYIEIRRLLDDRPLVAAVEVLSPTNKCTAQGRADYLRKRADYRRAKVRLMEIDLLRRGRHLISVPPARLRASWATPYKAAASVGDGSGGLEMDYYPISLRERLPRVRLPIRPDDPPVILDLQQPIDHVYRRGRYGSQIDYARPPAPPLSADDAAWAAERIAATRAL